MPGTDYTSILIRQKLGERNRAQAAQMKAQALSPKEQQALADDAAIIAMTKVALEQYQKIAPQMKSTGAGSSPSLAQGMKYNHPIATQMLGVSPVDPDVERYYNYAGQVRTRVLRSYLGGRMGEQLIKQIGQHVQDPSRTTAKLSAQQMRNLAEGIKAKVRATTARNPDALAEFNKELEAALSTMPKVMGAASGGGAAAGGPQATTTAPSGRTTSGIPIGGTDTEFSLTPKSSGMALIGHTPDGREVYQGPGGKRFLKGK